MTQILQLSVRKFKMTMISMLRVLIGKVYNWQQHRSNIIREINFLRKNKKKRLGMKNPVAEMMNAF